MNVLKSSLNPVCLKEGDKVDIIAPSSKCNPSVVEKFQQILHSWGLHSHVPKDLFGTNLLYANTDQKRFEHLEKALFNSDSQAIWCLLGGFGATKLLSKLKSVQPLKQAKLFIGFSDITALHLYFNGIWGWSTLSGPSGYQIALNKISEDSIALLKKALFHPATALSYHHLVPLNQQAQNAQVIEAQLMGGNLHLIQASLGTFWQIQSANKIIFIEDCHERAYRIDRILTQLEQAGSFRHAKAIIFGDMIDAGEPDGRFLVEQLIQTFAMQCPLPVLQMSHVGHGKTHYPLWLGRPAKLTLGSAYHLEFLDK